MLMPEIGSYVIHAKLPELGSGEILSAEKGALRIRFASGDRNFVWDMVHSHLEVTSEAPVPAPRSTKRTRKAKAEKTA